MPIMKHVFLLAYCSAKAVAQACGRLGYAPLLACFGFALALTNCRRQDEADLTQKAVQAAAAEQAGQSMVETEDPAPDEESGEAVFSEGSALGQQGLALSQGKQVSLDMAQELAGRQAWDNLWQKYWPLLQQAYPASSQEALLQDAETCLSSLVARKSSKVPQVPRK